MTSMKMNVRQSFNQKPFEERAALVHYNSKLIHSSRSDFYYIHLYEWKGELIEVVYNMNRERITEIQMLEYADLDIHLENIKLTRLI